ncbi:hypothetical protein IMZ08_03435 [Bacillus luteolus]|uniref:Uncharacterized protein n=1 Tax=Litchfieldia luteola TaxID=682179 RepID=A0ABR9QF53_9BACI|nr:hypothetical protein [Cytobacillus luteolus]MBE4907110.1 hypothetical protein [Cytobacillus luteolus]MBP1943421.1 putative RND superfamily exporter protein [Cytobacillus luteolus]
MVRNLLFIGIVLELIVFSTIIILDSDTKTAAHSPYKEMSPYEAKAVSSEFLNKQALPVSQNSIALVEIKSTYEERFEKLEDKTNNEMRKIANQAYEEYVQGDQDLVSLLSMTKYVNELKALENETDEAFYHIYDELSKELVSNGYPDSEAIEFKTEFEAKKKEQVKEILRMATSELNSN